MEESRNGRNFRLRAATPKFAEQLRCFYIGNVPVIQISSPPQYALAVTLGFSFLRETFSPPAPAQWMAAQLPTLNTVITMSRQKGQQQDLYGGP